jgi:hypothetical protein
MMYLCCKILQNPTLLDGSSMVDVCVCSWSRKRRLCSELFSETIDNPNMTLHQHTSANLARPLRHTASNSVPNWLRCDHICVPKRGHFLPFPVFRIPINHVTVTHISHPGIYFLARYSVVFLSVSISKLWLDNLYLLKSILCCLVVTHDVFFRVRNRFYLIVKL